MIRDERSRRRTTRMPPPKYYSPETDPFGTFIGIVVGAGLVALLLGIAELARAWS